MGPYEGIRILELSESIAAAYGGMLLAELGADVVKVEPHSGDPMRAKPGFHVWNRSKRSVMLDFWGKDRKVLRKLAADADIIITDLVPEEAQRLGFTYEDIKRDNSAVIYCSTPPMGSQGPRRNLAKDDNLVAAYSALMGQQWSYRGGPVYLVIPISSYGTALLAAGAIGAALCVRERKGVGQRVEVSWLAGSLAMQAMHICRREGTAEPSYIEKDAPRGGQSAVYRSYQASDGWLFPGCGSPTFARKLFIALGVPELVSDPRYAEMPWGIPKEHRPALQKLIEKIISQKTVAEWIRILRENDVPCAPIQSREEFLKDPQALHNAMVVEVADPELGRTLQMNVPVSLSLTPGGIQRAAPRLGEHNREVLRELEGKGKPRRKFGTSLPPVAPLAGLKVIDLTNYVAGPAMTRHLAELGADIIKVESWDGDALRYQAFSFVNMNRGKRDVVIDLKTQEGQKIIHELIKEADILVMNFRPNVVKRLNLDYDTVRRMNPKIICYSGTAWGKGGAYEHLPGFDPLIQALSGLMEAQGGRGQEPAMFYVGIQDHATALQAMYSTLAALYYRERSGQGQLVESCILNSGFTMQSGELISYDQKPPEPDGGRDLIGLSALCRLYQAKDGWLMLSVKNMEQWSSLAEAMGHPEWTGEYLAAVLTEPAGGAVAKMLETTFATRPREEWLRLFDKADVPCAPALTYDEIVNDPQVKAEGLFEIEDSPEWGKLWVTARLIKFSETPATPVRGVPSLGQHDREVLEELGYNSEQIEELQAKKVVK